MTNAMKLVSETIGMDDEAAFAHVEAAAQELAPAQMEKLNQELSALRDKVKRVARALQPALDEAARQLRLEVRKARLKRELADAEAGIEHPAEKTISI